MNDWFLAHDDLEVLLDVLGRDYRLIGPRVVDGAIVFADLDRAGQLPVGVRDQQSPGRYRLTNADGKRCFDFACGPSALKPLTFAPTEVLWHAREGDDGSLQYTEAVPTVQPAAVIGVRSCDLAALQLQEKHFVHGAYPDRAFIARRRSLFLVAVDCAAPSGVCFCASTGDGPDATAGYDMALTELHDGFLIRARSDPGIAVLDELPVERATDEQMAKARAQREDAVAAQQRRLPVAAVRGALMTRLDDPYWAAVAERCLSCGNCTSVCPTCFCHAETDTVTDDAARCAQHCREWDNCFGNRHSYIHGWVVRDTTKLRYRQWVTHKLDTWNEQFGRSGCVGCGRCITWCPTAIDITASAAALLGDDRAVDAAAGSVGDVGTSVSVGSSASAGGSGART